MYRPEYFSIEELVPPEVLSKYGEEASWTFMDERILIVIDWLRGALNRSITINNWNNGGSRRDSGYRTNQYTKRLYCSAHLHGRAIDCLISGMEIKDVHQWLRDNEPDIPVPIWVEDKDGMSWLHIDVRYSNKGKLYFFRP